MSTLGTDQFAKKKFERLALSDEWKPVMGNLPSEFMIAVYGESGEGKTEFCLQLAKELTRHGSVKWMEYESGHGADIQDGIVRNDFKGLPINWDDPWEEDKGQQRAIAAFVPPPDMPMQKNAMANRVFISLYIEMSKPKSAKYWVINSVDATGLNKEQVMWLFVKFKKKKGIIFICHSQGTTPILSVSKAIEFYGQVGIHVKHYIARPLKSRFQGFTPRVVFEQRARELDPLFFIEYDKKEQEQKKVEKKKRKPKAQPSQDVQLVGDQIEAI